MRFVMASGLVRNGGTYKAWIRDLRRDRTDFWHYRVSDPPFESV